MLYEEKIWNGKRRGNFDIINDILECALNPKLKTEIMYRANLSFSQLKIYLNLLTSTNLIEERNFSRIEYKTTEKGRQFISNYKEIQKILNSNSRA